MRVPSVARPSSSLVIKSENDPFGAPASSVRATAAIHAAIEPFMSAVAAADQDAVDDLGCEGVGAPGLRVARRHHVGVAGVTEVRTVGPAPGVEVLHLAEAQAAAGEVQALEFGLHEVHGPFVGGVTEGRRIRARVKFDGIDHHRPLAGCHPGRKRFRT